MTTRYSLPRQAEQSDTARSARTLAALVLAFAMLAIALLAAVAPPDEPAMASSPGSEPASAPTVVGARA